jgi:hypothetical protein
VPEGISLPTTRTSEALLTESLAPNHVVGEHEAVRVVGGLEQVRRDQSDARRRREPTHL